MFQNTNLIFLVGVLTYDFICRNPVAIMYEHVDPYHCDPPGTFREVLTHPGGGDRTVEKAIIMEHRFAFFFWMKWRNALNDNKWLQQEAPTLITIDWHRDLAPPTKDQKTALKKLDQSKLDDIANYVWAQFDQTNDGHILSAAWLNIIGDVIVLKNSAGEMRESFTDVEGNEHNSFEFREYDRLEKFLLERNDQNIFLDIDLDYFIHGKCTRDGYRSDDFQRYSDEEIRDVIDYQSPIFQHILPHIDGLTIAQEPGFCGGIANSCRIMEVVQSQLFNEKNKWLHLE